MKWIVDARNPPPNRNCDHWHRSKDPWHRDAFPDEHKGSAPNQGTPRGEGWMAEDWCGNPETFIPDGTEVDNGY